MDEFRDLSIPLWIPTPSRQWVFFLPLLPPGVVPAIRKAVPRSQRHSGRPYRMTPNVLAPGFKALFMALSEDLRTWASRIKRDGVTLWFACRNPSTPVVTKMLCVFVVAYALSPIDLVPDFIPVLGYVDDVLLLPGLIWLAIRLIPPEVLAASRIQAETWLEQERARPTSYWGVAFVVCTWIAVAYGAWIALR